MSINIHLQSSLSLLLFIFTSLTFLRVGKTEWSCQFDFQEEKSCRHRFPWCRHSFLVFLLLCVYPPFQFRWYLRVALRARAGQFIASVCLHDATAELVLSIFVLVKHKGSIFPITQEWRCSASCQVTFSCHARWVSTSPRPTGSTCLRRGCSRSQESFLSYCLWRFVSPFILNIVTVLTTRAFLTAENKGLSFTETHLTFFCTHSSVVQSKTPHIAMWRNRLPNARPVKIL